MKSALLPLVLATGVFLLSSCGGTGGSDVAPLRSVALQESADSTGTPADGHEVSSPSEFSAVPIPAGQIERALAQLDGIASHALSAFDIPGIAVAVVHGGNIVYAKGFGVRALGNPALVNPDTVFQLASLSKPITATVVARQVGGGSLTWESPVQALLPSFALSDEAVNQNLTIGDLLSHRSGLPEHIGDKLEDLGYSRNEVLNRLRYVPLFPFRAHYGYTNFGFTAAAEAVAAAAGSDWDNLSEQTLFQPLGMLSTSTRYADYLQRANRASGHVKINGQYQPGDRRNPDAQAAAGGVSSSVNDVAQWMRMLLANGRVQGRSLIPETALLPALSPQVISVPASSPSARAGQYGYGFNVGVTAAGRVMQSHSGAFVLGAATSFAILPSADIGIVVLTNAQPVGAAETVSAQFLDLVQLGATQQDWTAFFKQAFAVYLQPVGSLVGVSPPAKARPSRPWEALVGTYRNDFYGPLEVQAASGQLQLRMATGVVYPLRHWDADTFTFELDTENAPPGSISTARFDASGLLLEYYDDVGLGRFVK